MQTVVSLHKSIPKLMRTRTPAAVAPAAAPIPRPSRDQPPPPFPAPLPQDPRHRRRSPGPQMRQAAPAEPVEEIHPDDRFHQRIELFLHSSRSKARYIVMLLRDIFENYWQLAVFFEDPWAVYPPPQRKDDLAEDIFVFFHSFLSEVATASKEVVQLRLREEIAAAQAKASGVATVTDTPADAASSATAGSSACSSASVPQAVAKPLLTRAPSPGPQAGIKRLSTRAPSPGPQVVTMSRSNSETKPLDVTMLRRLQSRNSADLSMTRTRSLSKTRSSSIGVAPTLSASRVEDEDDGQQSDVSDWQDSPRKEASPARERVKPKPLFAVAVAVAPPKPQAERVSLGGPPQRSVRRQASASPSPAGRSNGMAPSNFRATPSALCSGTVNTAAVMSNQVSSSQGAAVPSVVAAVVPMGQSSATTALGPPPTKRVSCVPSAAPTRRNGSAAALGPPPARSVSREGRRSLLPSRSGSPSRGAVRPNYYSSKKAAESPPIASPMRSRPTNTACAQQPSPCFTHSSPSHSPAPASLTPPRRQPQPKPTNATQGPPRRKSLSMAADRIQKEKLKELLGSADSGEDQDEHNNESQSEVRKMWQLWPERRCRSNSSDSRSPSPAPLKQTSSPAILDDSSPVSGWVQCGLQAMPRVQRRSLQVCGSDGAEGCDRHSMGGNLLGELQAEVARRRSLSLVGGRRPGSSPRTPKRKHAGAGGGHELTPVEEPGETPHTGSCRSRGSESTRNARTVAGRASADHSIFSLTRD